MSSASSPVSMMTPESDAAPASPHLEEQDCRAMIRHLLARYSRREVDRLLEEEGCQGTLYTSQQPAIAYSGPFHAVDAAPSALPFHSQRSDPGLSGISGPSPRPSGRSPSYRTDYACGFCAEIGITKTCTRRNDLRRHIDQFHNTNAQWLCQHPGCHMAFDWQTAYQIHLRNEHGGSQMRMDEAKVVLCPQTVFACGYEGCHQVYEAANDTGAVATWKAYTAHLIKHCEEGRGSGRWEYSHRIRNLLRQSRVAAAWKSAWPEAGQSPLRWDPVSSRTLRKLLETRHLDNLARLLSCTVMLASPPVCTKQLETGLDLHLPVKKLCPAAAIKHEMRSSPLPREPEPEPEPELAEYANLQGRPQAQLAAPPYAGYADPRQAAATPMASPQAFYGMLGPAMYQAPGQTPQYVAGRKARPSDLFAAVPPLSPAMAQSGVLLANDAGTIPRGPADSWADVYGSTGLHSPALTDAYYDMGSPLAPGQQGIPGAYGPPRSS